MERKTVIRLTILIVILLAIAATFSGCVSDAEFGDGQNAESIGQYIIDTADAADETLNQNPGLDAIVGPEAKPAVGLYRLIGEGILAFGLFLQTRRRKELENAIAEIDENPETPPAVKQAVSIQSRKTIRKAVQ